MRLGEICLALGITIQPAAFSQVAQQMDGTPEDGIVRELVRPSTTNPAIRQFDEPNVVLLPRGAPADVPLVVFLPGTGGKPENARLLLETVAEQGYRVLGLEYDDEPAVMWNVRETLTRDARRPFAPCAPLARTSMLARQ